MAAPEKSRQGGSSRTVRETTGGGGVCRPHRKAGSLDT